MLKNNDDVLHLVYQVREGVEYEVSQDGIVTFLLPQDHVIQRIFRRLGAQIPAYKRLSLDEYGSHVFILIDGKRTVEEIGQSLEETFGERTHPLYERLLVFLNYLDVDAHYIRMP